MIYYDATQRPGFENRPPFQTLRESQVDEALERARAPIRLAATWPEPPEIALFPARYGYGDRAERTPTIASVLQVSGEYQNRRDDWQGGPAEINSSARNIGSGMW